MARHLSTGFQDGDLINIEFSVKGREWTNPQGEVIFFTTLEAWKLEKVQQTTETPDNANNVNNANNTIPVNLGVDDDLPF